MTAVLLKHPPQVLDEWLERRRALGQDGYDEVWDEVYHVVPMAHGRQGRLQVRLTVALDEQARRAGLEASGPVNIGRPGNFRVPDGAFFRGADTALWNPTAAIVVEILSPDDDSWLKLGFYFDHGVEELLYVDPDERTVQWFVRDDDAFAAADASALLAVTATALHDRIDWPA